MIWSLVALLMTAPSSGSPDCTQYVGKRPAMQGFREVWTSLPKSEPQGPYESVAAYQLRLAALPTAASGPIFVRGTHRKSGISYNRDSGELRIYDTALGVGEIDYSDVFGRAILKGSEDNYTQAAGFMLDEVERAKEVIPATNGFGARFDVTRTGYQRNAVWAHAGLFGKSIFEATKPFKPIAQLNVTGGVAEELVEHGYPALLIQPRAPFRATGASVTSATFSQPYATVADISVIIADVKCAFVVRGSGEIFLAFTVK